MRATIQHFMRGDAGRLAAGVSALATWIAITRFVAGSRSFWMWLFFAAMAYVALAFWRQYQAQRWSVECRVISPPVPAEGTTRLFVDVAYIGPSTSLRARIPEVTGIVFEDFSVKEPVWQTSNSPVKEIERDGGGRLKLADVTHRPPQLQFWSSESDPPGLGVEIPFGPDVDLRFRLVLTNLGKSGTKSTWWGQLSMSPDGEITRQMHEVALT